MLQGIQDTKVLKDLMGFTDIEEQTEIKAPSESKETLVHKDILGGRVRFYASFTFPVVATVSFVLIT